MRKKIQLQILILIFMQFKVLFGQGSHFQKMRGVLGVRRKPEDWRGLLSSHYHKLKFIAGPKIGNLTNPAKMLWLKDKKDQLVSIFPYHHRVYKIFKEINNMTTPFSKRYFRIQKLNSKLKLLRVLSVHKTHFRSLQQLSLWVKKIQPWKLSLICLSEIKARV